MTTTFDEQHVAGVIRELTEALADAEAMLAVEDRGWSRLGSERDLEPSVLKDKAEQIALAAIFNPLIKRGLTLGEAYVWGSGVGVSVRDEADDGQDINGVVQDFLDDVRSNPLTELEKQLAMERALGTWGEVWLALPTDMRSGKVSVRTIPPAEVTRIVCNPEDSEERWFILREWSQGEGPVRRLYPILGYRPARRDRQYLGLNAAGQAQYPELRNVEIHWDTPVRPLQVNVIRNRGIGYGAAAIPWALAYKTYLEAWHKLMVSLSKFAWRVKTRSDKAAEAAHQVLQALPGSAVASDPNTQLEAVSRSGATFDAGSGRPIAAMVASALDLPVTVLLSDPGVTGARAVAETLDYPTELVFGMRRRLWASVFEDICGWVIDVAVFSGKLRGTIVRDGNRTWAQLPEGDTRTVVVDWPEYSSVPVETLVKSIVLAQQTDVLPDLAVLRLLLKALNVQDADEILDQMTDEDGNFIPPATTRGEEPAEEPEEPEPSGDQE